MWTNVFRIGELQTVSWFQLLPCEPDPNSLSDKSFKAEQKDAATYVVLSAHLQLQNEGFLSTWTNSFVGPWDPSQGVHNPDEKIKLWLFLPGRHSSITETAQAAVSRLRVVGNGVWSAPGDSEEIALALSQALRNSIERALRGLSYVRFGDVFTRCNSFEPSERNFRRLQPIFEFVFTATEEAIYVHAVISSKSVRGLCGDDLERALRHRSSSSAGKGLPVIIAPNGMHGRLTGCCPSDLVKQVYISKHKASNGGSIGLPFQSGQSSGCQLRGQNCFAEVTLGCASTSADKSMEANMSLTQNKDTIHPHMDKVNPFSVGRSQQKQLSADQFPNLARTFIFPAEAVLLPILNRAFARSSMKRVWLQSFRGASPFDMWPLWNLSASAHIEHCFESSDGYDFDSTGMKIQCCYDSSSSISSGISSISSTSSESGHGVALGGRDLEADADSLTCRQSGLSSNDQFDNDGHEMVSRRPRTSIAETISQTGTIVNANIREQHKSEYSAVVDNSAAAGIANTPVGSQWDWDEDDDRGVGMDIHVLLSEFGDFSDFFKEEVLAFGEPPGIAESQGLMFPSTVCGDVYSSPCTTGMDISDQKFSPAGLASFEGFNHPSGTIIDDAQDVAMEFTKDARSSLTGSCSSLPSAGNYEYLAKAEAVMTFASEYAAVETPASESSVSIFRSPYLPSSKRIKSSHSSSNAYVYSATPPSPDMGVPDEKMEVSVKIKSGILLREASSNIKSEQLYSQVRNLIEKNDKGPFKNDLPSCVGEAPSSISGTHSLNSVIGLQHKNYNTLDAGYFLLAQKPVLASEIECIMFQASMCRIRHTLLSLSNQVPSGLNKLRGNVMSNQVIGDSATIPDLISSKYEVKKKDSIPLRIAGDVDGGMIDGPVTAQVGVWRSVGAPKAARHSNARTVENVSMPHNALNDGSLIIQSQMMSFQELLDAIPLLVQQSTSVDISLDTDDGDGSFCWLALEEQRRRGFSCGPSMVHAGCGGLLARCHSVDIAGVDLIDPLSADIQVSSVTSLLQTDVKTALKSAFGNLEGPLSVIDWCKGRCQSGDSSSVADVYSFQYTIGDTKDSTSSVTGEPISPPQSSGGSSCTREGSRIDESSHRRSNPEICNSESELQKGYSRFRPTLAVLPLPTILVGYQDDWLKTSPSCLQLWEKAPLEPYALPKPVTYHAVCPDIDILTSAAADFFQQLGTVYETCKLGTHSPQISGGQMVMSPGKCLPSGLTLVDSPEQVKVAANNLAVFSSTYSFFHALSKGWSVKNFVKDVAKVLKNLKLVSSSSVNQKESSTGPCMVVYVVCPFPEPTAVLQTLVECSAALGSVVFQPEKERRSLLYSQVAKALNSTAAVDEASASNVLMLSGFSIPKLVLQIVSVESLLRINRPSSELSMLKDIAFTVYNKARRVPRAHSSVDLLQPLSFSGRSQSTLMHANSSSPGLWKDCLTPRMSGSSLTRESELDVALRSGAWDNSWQTSRAGSLSCEPNRPVDFFCCDDVRYSFEPLLILAEPGAVERGVSNSQIGSGTLESSNSKSIIEENSGIFMPSSTSGGSADTVTGSLDGSENDHRAVSLHCSYGWTEDWRWLVCIWTDSRGELLDSNIFPFGGISSRQDTKLLHCLFVQVLHQGCQIVSCSSPDAGSIKPKDIIITRIGSFFELECQEWQKAIYSIGGAEVKKWTLQLRRSTLDAISSSTNGSSLQQQDMSLLQERNLVSSPSPPFYSSHAKSSFMKGSLGQANTKKQLLPGQSGVGSSRGLLHMVQSISLVSVSIDHSLHLILQAETSSGGGTQSSSGSGLSGYLEGFSPVKSLGSLPASYLLIPSPSLRYLPPAPLQLPTCLTSESPPLAHLLHSKGCVIPLATGYVVSKAVPSMRKDLAEPTKEDWPSILAVNLIDHYGGNIGGIQEKVVRGTSASSIGKQGRTLGTEAMNRDHEMESHLVLESVAAELHALSWMTVSPVFLERRTALPFHCDMLLRLRRLLHYADKKLSRPPEEAQQS